MTYVNEGRISRTIGIQGPSWWKYIYLGTTQYYANASTEVPQKEKRQYYKVQIKSSERDGASLLICGDFNYREIYWKTNPPMKTANIVTEPIRYRYGEDPSLLDLILYNEEGMVYNRAHKHGLGDREHTSLAFSLICQKEYYEKS